jgi:hypothetical protein
MIDLMFEDVPGTVDFTQEYLLCLFFTIVLAILGWW